MKYNSLDLPDLAGSLEEGPRGHRRTDAGAAAAPLRHRQRAASLFRCAGCWHCGTRAITTSSAWTGSRWSITSLSIRMSHITRWRASAPLSQQCRQFGLTPIPGLPRSATIPAGRVSVGGIRSSDQTRTGTTSADLLRTPINDYRVFVFTQRGEPANIVVCREAMHDGASALRVVDFYGDEQHIRTITAALARSCAAKVTNTSIFVCSGFTGRLIGCRVAPARLRP